MPERLRRLFAAAIVLILCAPGAQGQARDVDPAISTLLEFSAVESILAGVHDDIITRLSALGAEPTPDQSAVLSRLLSVDALLPIMERHFEELGDPRQRAAAARLVEDGAIARVRSLVETQPPATTLQEYMDQLRADPPPPARMRLISEVASAQAAGAFYVLLDERTREAAHIIAGASGTTAEPFEPITEQTWVARAQQGHLQAMVSFLHLHENVPDDLMRASLEGWTSEAGAWFVEAYSVALGETVLAAAESVAAAFGRQPGSQRTDPAP